MKRRFWGRAAVNMMVWAWCVLFLWSCGYSGEEKQRMEEIARQGEENAEKYVQEKYGFVPEIEDVELCMERGDGDPVPWGSWK